MAERHPLLKTREVLPGLEKEHEVSLTGVGVSIITATLGCNTSLTDAELIAAPPNTGVAVACGPIVHSLATAPTCAIIQQYGGSAAALTGQMSNVGFQLCTMDNSAVYFYAKTWTGGHAGVAVQVVVIR